MIEISDAELLERFVTSRDEAAFAALMARHGPMVLGVCRRLLRHTQDAEDAFQATFLILVRKAASIGKRELLGNWLYGVALRVASRARDMAAKRRKREATAMQRIAEATKEPMEVPDVSAAIAEEVQRLPAKYRIPVVLCYLQGRSNEDAAGEMRCPVGTVKTRLSRAREMLRTRLTNRGLALSTAVFSTALSVEALAAPVPPALIDSALKAALDFAAGDASALGLVSAQAAALTKGVLHTMFVSKMKILAGWVLALGVVLSLVFRILPKEPIADPDPTPVRLKLPVASEQKAAESIRELGGWYEVDKDNHVIEVNMVYHYTPEKKRYDNMRTDTDAALRAVRTFPRLKRLLLHKGQATDEALASVAGLKDLEAIYIWDAEKITDAGVKNLADLTRLQNIHINNGRIGDRALEIFAHLPALKHLSLQGNAFSDEGLKQLEGMKQLRTLWIGLNRGPITDAGIKHLTDLPMLEELDLQGASLSDELYKELRKRRPKLKLHLSGPARE